MESFYFLCTEKRSNTEGYIYIYIGHLILNISEGSNEINIRRLLYAIRELVRRQSA